MKKRPGVCSPGRQSKGRPTMKKVVKVIVALVGLLVISSIVGFYVTAAVRRNDWFILVVPMIVSALIVLSTIGAIRELERS